MVVFALGRLVVSFSAVSSARVSLALHLTLSQAQEHQRLPNLLAAGVVFTSLPPIHLRSSFFDLSTFHLSEADSFASHSIILCLAPISSASLTTMASLLLREATSTPGCSTRST